MKSGPADEHNAGCADEGDRATTTAAADPPEEGDDAGGDQKPQKLRRCEQGCDGKQEEDVAGADGVSDREPPQTEVAEESRSR